MLRGDVTELDIGIAVAMISRVGGTDRSQLRERYVTLVLDGLAVRRDGPSPLAPVPASEDDLACIVAPARRR